MNRIVGALADACAFRVADLPRKTFPGGIVLRSVSLDDLMMTFVEYPPGAAVASHRHRREQITCVLEGELEVIIDGASRMIGPGEGVRIPRNVEHGSRAIRGPVRAVDAWTPVPERLKVEPAVTLGAGVPVEGESID